MGHWHIAIEGTGPHHNKDYDKDANRMAVEFVKALRAAGHTVESATFTHGGRDDVAHVPLGHVAEPVARIKADFNARLEDGRVNLGTKGSWLDVRAHVKEHGQRVVLTDGEIEVDAEIVMDVRVPGGTTAKLLGEFRDVPGDRS